VVISGLVTEMDGQQAPSKKAKTEGPDFSALLDRLTTAEIKELLSAAKKQMKLRSADEKHRMQHFYLVREKSTGYCDDGQWYAGKTSVRLEGPITVVTNGNGCDVPEWKKNEVTKILDDAGVLVMRKKKHGKNEYQPFNVTIVDTSDENVSECKFNSEQIAMIQNLLETRCLIAEDEDRNATREVNEECKKKKRYLNETIHALKVMENPKILQKEYWQMVNNPKEEQNPTNVALALTLQPATPLESPHSKQLKLCELNQEEHEPLLPGTPPETLLDEADLHPSKRHKFHVIDDIDE
jgi:hypothetical protein